MSDARVSATDEARGPKRITKRLDGDLVAIAVLTATEGFLRKTAPDTWTLHKSNLNASAAPGATDDNAAGYSVGSLWIDTTADKSYICVDATAGAALWNDVTAGGGSQAYTPADLNDWQNGLDPGDVPDALDQLASRIRVLESGILTLSWID